jgi:alanine-glyoxylate transaminase / serine-glyoxylate transaminase / serine-pyruvate transaminase
VTLLPPRVLLGSGPSIVPQRVLDALAQPTVGHLDPEFGALMDDTSDLLRAVFRTSNRVAFPVSGTGSAGMQTMVDTLIAPGDRVICGVCGLFGLRMADALRRRGADVVTVEADWGRAIPTEALLGAAREPFRALFVVHAETSTGVLQPLDGLADACRAHDALLLVDCVTSLGGVPLDLDGAGVDAAFSGTQKCLACPPGLAPFTLNDRAAARVLDSPSWYFDVKALLGYWLADGARAYHHTAPINMVYALHEALQIVVEEGLEARWARHATAHDALVAALAQLGLPRLAPEEEKLASLIAVTLPDGVDDAAVRRTLLADHGIEIAAGAGQLAGKAWRIGVMGEGARPEPQEQLVTALGVVLGIDAGGALDALRDGWAVS